MPNITPHLWFDKEAKEAAEFYTSLLSDSNQTAQSDIIWCVANSFIRGAAVDTHPIDGIGRKPPLRSLSGFAWLKKNPSPYRRACGMRKPVESRSRPNLYRKAGRHDEAEQETRRAHGRIPSRFR